MSEEHTVHHGGIGTYIIVFSILLILTGVTVAAAFVDFGPFNIVIALLIAFIKATLVMLFFMHLKGTPNILKIFVISAFAWVAILIGMTLNDFGTRAWGPRLEKDTWIARPAYQYNEVSPATTAHVEPHHS